MDILLCVERLNMDFELIEMYSFEKELSKKHPGNRFIREKIRQQLQKLRDAGFIEFMGDGRYKKVT